MRDWTSKAAAAVAVVAMILSYVPLARTYALPAPSIWLTPEKLTFNTHQNHVGDKFNVTVWINTVEPSYAWQIQVNFNASQLNAVRAEYTGQGKSMFFTGHNTVAVSPTIDNATGFVLHGESLVGFDQAAAGSNSVFIVEFMIMAEPAEDETLTSIVSVDSNPDYTFILDSDSNSVSNVSMGSAVYTLGPVRSAIWFKPETLMFYTNQNHAGDKFNVTVWINTTKPSYAWQIQVDFNASQLNAVRAEYTGQGKSMFFTGHDTIPVSSAVDNSTGSVAHGESLIGQDQIAAGCNSAFWVEFMIMAEPAENETLTSLISIDSDPDNTFILEPSLNWISNLDLGSALYTLGPAPPMRDVALTSLALSTGHAKQGDNVTVTVVVLNNGTASETFDVSLTFDSSPIAVLNVFQLKAGESTTLYFEWNTTSGSFGDHTITATATVVASDVEPTNNSKSKNLVIVAGSADVNGDGRVDMVDIAIVAHAFGTREGYARWNPAADISSVEKGVPDGEVNMFDVAMVSHSFGASMLA